MSAPVTGSINQISERHSALNLGKPIEILSEHDESAGRIGNSSHQAGDYSPASTIAEHPQQPNPPHSPGKQNYTLNEKHTPSTSSSDVTPQDYPSSGNQIAHIARQLSRQSTRGGHGENIFGDDKDPALDPFSPHFNARRWVRGATRLAHESGPSRTSGLSYRNMSVHGFGSESGEFCSILRLAWVGDV